MADKPSSYETWLWIELIGFDNERPDFGVGDYLDKAGLVPDAVSLFIFNPDFVHTHDGVEADRVFPYDYSSYGGHPCSYERERQDWTRHQLLGLVRELQAHGIAVFFAVFDTFATDEWIGGHPELLHVTREGRRMGSICPYKRLADGSYYEDFFARQLGRVLDDYGFDGFHQADGYCHPRLTLYQGDFSDDIVEQFLAASGVALPEGLAPPSGDSARVIDARGEWIWRHARREWIDFYAGRVTSFCAKVAAAVHARGKQVWLNNALTRDPLQALYRHGVDYQRLAEVGVDGFIVEMVAPGVTIGGESGLVASPHYDFQATLLLMKACVPGLGLRCLNGVHDVNEQWDVLRHGAQLLEREIYCQGNEYRWRQAGSAGGKASLERASLERCSLGPVVCLADGLERHEWRWLRDWWGLAFAVTPARIRGATLVWSDAAHARQLDDYLASRRFTTHKLLYELTSRGAPVYCSAGVGDLAGVEGPLLVLNPHLFPEDELAAVLAYENGPVVATGPRAAGLPPADFELEDVYPPGQLLCSVYGAGRADDFAALARDLAAGAAEAAEREEIPADLMALPEPPYYFRELYFRKVSDGFLAACARLLAECSGAVRVVAHPDALRVQALELADGRLRLFVGNDDPHYVLTELDVGREIAAATVVSRFPGTPPALAGSRFGLRVPGQGMVVVDVTPTG